ncbi:alpha/beta hydrolase family protein [Actinoplanes xinjiangensis]|nr:alpha/beta hydrolase [Actinoplanes xinjiangensis]
MKRKIALLVMVLLTAGVAAVLAGHDFRITERRVTIPTAAGSLDAVLVLPEDGPAHGLVVMVHGDGPVEATHDGLYRPWFEAAADAGFATLSWSKPGVGASTGDWLRQSMADRAVEASTVIDWARTRPDVPTGTVILWGASQAGWVVPRIAAERADITAIVAVSPAVNWLRQGRFHLLAELDHAGAGARERERAVAVSDQTRRLLEQRCDFATYRNTTDDDQPMDEARWGFVQRNHTADATADLRAVRVPVLLMLGDHDRNVDTVETENTYRQILGERVTVRRFDAAHSMAAPAMEEHTLLGLATGVFRPRSLLADTVLDTYRGYLDAAPAPGDGTGSPRPPR